MPTNGITDPIISTSWYSSPYRNFCLQLLKTKLKLWAHDEIFLGWSMFFVLGKQVHPVPSERLIGSSKGWETRGVIPLIPYETQVLLSKHTVTYPMNKALKRSPKRNCITVNLGREQSNTSTKPSLWWSRCFPQCIPTAYIAAPSKARLQAASMCRPFQVPFPFLAPLCSSRQEMCIIQTQEFVIKLFSPFPHTKLLKGILSPLLTYALHSSVKAGQRD